MSGEESIKLLDDINGPGRAQSWRPGDPGDADEFGHLLDDLENEEL